MEQRILIYAPFGKDAELTSQVLHSAGMQSFICRSLYQMLGELEIGAAALLIVEEALSEGALEPLGKYVAQQPTWSDLPIILLTHLGTELIEFDDVARLGNLTVLDRPVRTASLVSAARSALRARARQYEAREAGKRKDEFLASLAHELRNPLAPIRTSMGILKYMFPADPNVIKVREVVERQVAHLTRLVDDLLDVSRITNGTVELRREIVSLSGILSHAVEIVTPMLKKAQHVLEIRQPDQETFVNGDQARLVQSLANLLVNAVKFTPQPGAIRLAADVDGQMLVLSVKDPGIGMTRDSLVYIFDMFAQSDVVVSRALGGLGIGLSLAKRFTEMHGGTIEAKSDGPGLGSEFIMRLPIVTKPQQVRQSAAETPAASAPGQRILVVDDNRDAADTLSTLLAADGFSVSTAYDGNSAVERFREQKPDVIVMDIGLPGIDGYEAVRQIRKEPGGKEILMIALTGWGQESARQQAAEAGYDHHLVKPVDLNILRGWIGRGASAAA